MPDQILTLSILQTALLKRIEERIASLQSSPRFMFIASLVLCLTGSILYYFNKLKWIDIEGWWLLPAGIGLFTLLIGYPYALYAKGQHTPVFKRMYAVIKDKPEHIIWAYKLNTWRRSVVVETKLVLCSKAGDTISLKYNAQEEVDRILMAIPLEMNPAIAIGYTRANKEKYFNKR